MGHKTYSRTSPKDGRRATLDTNGKYSRENNKGFMINQGIGNLEGTIVSILSNSGEERVINSSSTDYQL